MIATTESPLLAMWSRHVGWHRNILRLPRPFVSMSYIARGPIVGQLVPIEHLTLVVLCDVPLHNGQVAGRLAGFTGTPVPWGVEWGGRHRADFIKDLRLRPEHCGEGLRIDLTDEDLLKLALDLEHVIHRCDRHRRRTGRMKLKLPQLWAAFTPLDAIQIAGAGPELKAASLQRQLPPQTLFRRTCRAHGRHVLFPLDWVSHEWDRIAAIYADLDGFPSMQTIRAVNLATVLAGQRGAAAFDFQPAFRPARREATGMS